MSIRSITDLRLRSRRVFIRADLNVPLRSTPEGVHVVADDMRLRAALPTLEYALGKGARVILASHLGRPKGAVIPDLSLAPVGERLSELLGGMDIPMPESCIGDGPKKLIGELHEGELMLLENLRFHPGETTNDSEFAKDLAALAEVYVNDAFGTSHRAHASTTGMVRYFHREDRGMGFTVQQEVKQLEHLLRDPSRPFVAILGGAKVSEKIGVITNLLTRVDALLIGGAMAYTFLKAQGTPVGQSLVEEDRLKIAAAIMEEADEAEVALALPVDHVAAPSMADPAAARTVDALPDDLMGLDIGPKTRDLFARHIAQAKTIFWNGPVGVFETPPFNDGTIAIAKAVAESHSFSVVGGGDSLAAVRAAGVDTQISRLSTGGGASLEFLEGKTLPGLAALEEGDSA